MSKTQEVIRLIEEEEEEQQLEFVKVLGGPWEGRTGVTLWQDFLGYQKVILDGEARQITNDWLERTEKS